MEIIKIDKSNINALLELFEKDLDKEGYITEKKSGEKVICPYSGEPVNADDFSIIPGSATFVNNYYYCFSEYLAKNRRKA